MDKEGWTIFACVVLLIAILVGAAMWDSAQCTIQTAGIGFPSKWDLVGGCLIEPKSGQWMPLDNWRLIE